MKVLLGHEYYRSGAPSGEDSVFANERLLLERAGVEVVPFEFHNDDLDDSSLSERAKLALNAVWSRGMAKRLDALLKQERPDIAHFHNTFPAISPSAYAACRASGVPVVQTLHNFRLICPGALLMRDGVPCELCVGRLPLPALRYRCYRKSLAGTSAVVSMLAANRLWGSYHRLVGCYIALTEFGCRRFIEGGLPAERLVVRPNFVPDPPAPGRGGGGHALYVGRLTAEKGVDVLLEAWRRIDGYPLRIIGDGELRGSLEQSAVDHGLPVTFLGSQPRTEVFRAMAGADMVIVPSRCYESFSLVIAEAYACGTPVVASDAGAMAEIVHEGRTGKKFPLGDAAALAGCVNDLRHRPDLLAAMRREALAEFRGKYGADAAFTRLMEIYEGLLSQTSARAPLPRP